MQTARYVPGTRTNRVQLIKNNVTRKSHGIYNKVMSPKKAIPQRMTFHMLTPHKTPRPTISNLHKFAAKRNLFSSTRRRRNRVHKK
jgi:hypothetical protein